MLWQCKRHTLIANAVWPLQFSGRALTRQAEGGRRKRCVPTSPFQLILTRKSCKMTLPNHLTFSSERVFGSSRMSLQLILEIWPCLTRRIILRIRCQTRSEGFARRGALAKLHARTLVGTQTWLFTCARVYDECTNRSGMSTQLVRFDQAQAGSASQLHTAHLALPSTGPQ